MGNENHHHHHHHHHQFQHYQFYHHKSTFLPMLCSRPSIKEVSIPRWKKDRSASSTKDPLSPRIGCMGQVKRNNKVASGIPTSQQHRLSFTSSTISSPVATYSKLKKLFSGKNLTTPTTTTAATAVSGGGTRQRVVSKKESVGGCSIRIEEMDPPLPVRKRVPKMEEGRQMDSLWERRRRSDRPPALESLQLQQIHHPRICLHPTTV